jgi:hypothetical protein
VHATISKPTLEANMSKDAKKSGKSVQVSKKGAVINRRNNRTVNQDIAHSSPKWEDVGGGVLKKRGPGNKTAYITLREGKFVSLTRKQVDVALAPKDAPEMVEKKAA